MKSWLGALLALAALAAGMSSANAAEDRQDLAAKVKRYWAAEVAQDYATVYDLLGAENKGMITRDDYIALRRDTGPVRYTAAEVGETVYADDLAWVRLTYDWMFTRRPDAGARPGATWHLWRNAEGWYPIMPTDRDQWPMLPPTLRPVAEEAALKERVTGLWQAKVKEDWRGVYAYMPPWFRERNPLEKFLQNKAVYLYSAPAVQWVEADGAEARAAIVVGMKPNDAATTKMQPRVGKMIEPWVKIDGVWYLKVLPPEAQAVPTREQPELKAGIRQ